MDWPAFFTALTPIALAVIAAVGLYMNTRLAATKEAAEKAAAAVGTIEAKVDINTKQLDGQLTRFFEKDEADKQKAREDLAALRESFEKLKEAAFDRGREVGHDEATTGPIATKIDAVQEHLKQQDEKAEVRHEETRATNGASQKPADLETATEVTVEAAEHADSLAKKLKSKK